MTIRAERFPAAVVRQSSTRSTGILAPEVGIAAMFLSTDSPRFVGVVFQGRYLTFALSDFASWRVGGREVANIEFVSDPWVVLKLNLDALPGAAWVAPSLGGRLDADGRRWFSTGQSGVVYDVEVVA